MDLGKKLMGTEREEESLVAFERACEFEDKLCRELGRILMIAKPPWRDPKRGMQLLLRACDADDGLACAFAADWLTRDAEGVDPDPKKAQELDERGCDLGSSLACRSRFFQELEAGSPNERLRQYLRRGCDAGDRSACESIENYADPIAVVPDANLSLGRASADGFTIAEMQCRVKKPLLGGLLVLAELSRAHAKLDRCAPKGDAVAVEWTAKDGKMTKAAASKAGSEKVSQCVAKVLRGAPMGFAGRCAAVVLIGDSAGAEAALQRLRPKNP